MAKTYAFRFKAQQTTFDEHFASVLYGPGRTISEENREMTFAEALAYLPEFSNKTPGPHRAFLGMQSRHDRVPPGFNKATRHHDKTEAAEAYLDEMYGDES
jgi:hypothetical protein